MSFGLAAAGIVFPAQSIWREPSYQKAFTTVFGPDLEEFCHATLGQVPKLKPNGI